MVQFLPKYGVPPAVGEVGDVGVAAVVAGQRDGVARRLTAGVVVLHRPAQVAF